MKRTPSVLLAAAIVFLTGFSAFAAAPGPVPDTKPTIFVCGDSTSKFSGSETPADDMQGWGTPIAKFFDAEKVKINNVGHAGTSSRTYYNGDWVRVLPQIKSGDYVLIVFGINDGSTMDGIGDETRPGGARAGRGAARGAAATTSMPAVASAPAIPVAPAAPADPAVAAAVDHTYGWYMRKMATDALAKGAHPYFLTVTTRNIWTNSNPEVKYRDGTPIGELPASYDPKLDRIERGTANGKYTNYTKQVGQMIHVPVFDLTNACADLYESMGREAVNRFYRDHNHTHAAGAETVASVITSGLKGFKNSPFVPMLSEKGKALPAAEAKYVMDNLPEGK